MTITPEQNQIRHRAITATDFAALAGVHPYRTAFGVWLEKTGRACSDEEEESERVRWGNLLEPLLRSDFGNRHGVVVNGPCATIARSFEGVLAAATPDGIIEPWGCGWEGKTHSVALRREYGPPGTDEVPVHELLQCQGGMLVTGLRSWRLTAFLDGLPSDYAISADDALHGQMIEMAARWWRDHVVADRAPDIDSRDDSVLRALHPQDGALIRVATDDERAACLELKRAVTEKGRKSREAEDWKARVMAIIGDDAGIRWGLDDDDQITWRKARDTRQTDWQHAAYDFAGRVQLAASSPTIGDAVEIVSRLAAQEGFILEGGDLRVGCFDLAGKLRALIATIKSGIDVDASSKAVAGSRRFIMPASWKER